MDNEAQTELERATLAAIVRSSSDAIISSDLDGKITSWNKSAARMFGHSESEILGKSVQILIPSERLDEESKIISTIRRGEAISHFETERVTKEGTRIPVSLSVSPIFDSTGKVLGKAKILRDISEQRKTQEALRFSSEEAFLARQQLQAVVSILSAIVWAIDQKGVFLLSEGRGLESLDVKPDYIGKNIFDVYGDRVESMSYVRRALNGESCSFESDRNGRRLETFLSVIRANDGSVTGVVGLTIDITERKKHEEDLKKSERRFRTIFESEMFGMFFWNEKGEIFDANTECLRLLKYSREDLETGKIDWKKMTPEEFLPLDVKSLDELTRLGVCTPYEKEYICKDGSRLPILVGGTTLPESTEIGGIGFLIDNTARIEAREAIGKSEVNFRTLAETIPQIVWTATPDGVPDYHNRRWLDYTGMTLEQTRDRGWEYVLHPDDLQSSAQGWARALAAGETFQTEYRFRRASDGAYRWHLGRALPVRDEKGQVVKWFGTCTDIHDQKTALAVALEAKRRVEIILSNTDAFISSIDKTGIITYSDGKVLSAFGATPGDRVGRSIFELHKNIPELLEIDRRVLQGEKISRRIQFHGKWFDLSYDPLFDSDGRPNGATGVAIDVSEKVRSERALGETQEKLKAILRYVPFAFWAIDADRRFIFREGIGIKAVGMSSEEMLGRSIDEIYSGFPHVIAAMNRALSGESFEEQAQIGDRWYNVSFAPAFEDGKVIGVSGITFDITPRMHAEKVAKETQDKLKTVLTYAPIILWSTNKDGVVTHSDGSGLRTLGYESGQLLGQSVFDLYKDRPEATSLLRRALKGESFSAESSRGESFFDTHLAPLRDLDGQISGIVGLTTDVTARKRAEYEAQKSDVRFRATFNQAAVGIAHVSLQGEFISVNKRFCNLTGYSESELLGKTFSDITHPDDLTGNFENFESMLKGEISSFVSEKRYLKSSGVELWVNITVAPVLDETGSIQYLVTVIEDISEKRAIRESLNRANEALRASKQRLETLISNASVVLWAIDTQGIYTFSEGKGLSGTGLKPGERVGQSAFEVYKNRPEMMEIFKKALSGEEVKATVNVNGRWFESVTSPLRGSNGEIVGVVGASFDVTGRKSAELENTRLLVREQAAHHASKMKSEFVATISHEIRNPLNSIVGMGGLLADTTLTLDQRRYLSGLLEAVGSLKAIVNDVLDFSKIEAGRIEFEKVSFVLADVLQASTFLIGTVAEKKGLRVCCENDSDVASPLVGDPNRLKQILGNLLGNAAKFTDSGTITLRTREVDTTADQKTFRFEVIDTGIGLSSDLTSRIFSPFSQGDPSTARKYGGTGLGLVISRRLVEGMGGQIGVVSSPGAGACFWFELTFARTENSRWHDTISNHQIRNVASPSGQVFRVLVAEDNELNAEIAKIVLQKMGLQVDVARDGNEAISAAAEIDYDLILMDCQMPMVDGYEATKMIRFHNSGRNRDTPILALTANTTAADREKCLTAGMNDCLTKPIEPYQMSAAVSFWLDPDGFECKLSDSEPPCDRFP